MGTNWQVLLRKLFNHIYYQILKKIIFINSHPIQYFAPMYKYMNDNGTKTLAWYCSDHSIKGRLDSGFGVNVKWDIPLLQGYGHRFFKNYSWKPSIDSGFFGLMNFGMIRNLFREPKSVIVVHGWHYFTLFLILMLGKFRGHTICLRNDMPNNQEGYKKGWKQKIKKFGLKYILFPRINYFLYIGKQNFLFYKSYGISDSRLISTPFAVDNDRFGAEYKRLINKIHVMKKNMDIPVNDKIIVFSGKYVEMKRPLDLLRAFKLLDRTDCWLIMVGEGGLRDSMESLITELSLKQVILTGFVNQSKIAEYYAMADVMVMCSSLGENWGLSVNEAMNFDLPLVLSDLTGCSDDLVEVGNNGFIFRTGDFEELARGLTKVLTENALTKTKSSREIIANYSFNTVLTNLKPLTS